MSNTKMYEGDVNELPHCSVCKDEEGNPKEYAEDATHEFLTQEHPYEMLGTETQQVKDVGNPEG